MKAALIMGSDSDFPILKPAVSLLKEFGIEAEVVVASAHRTPAKVRTFVEGAPAKGISAFIVAAGAAAHLAGVVASYTTLPVIGIPINATALNGMDALLSTVQMPSGIPCATVAINGGKNAGILAAKILAVGDKALEEKLQAFQKEMRDEVVGKDEKLQREGYQSFLK